MANPTTMATDDAMPAIIEATSSQGSLTIPAGVGLDLYHLEADTSGTEATGAIMFSNTTGVAATFATGAKKWALLTGTPIPIPAQTAAWTLYFKAASGSPTFQIVPWLPRVVGQ